MAFTAVFEPPVYKVFDPNPEIFAKWATFVPFTLPHSHLELI
jgi:hypothetical protein